MRAPLCQLSYRTGEPRARLELAISTFGGWRLLHLDHRGKGWSPRSVSNRQPRRYNGRALPVELRGRDRYLASLDMSVGPQGIEPCPPGPKSGVRSQLHQGPRVLAVGQGRSGARRGRTSDSPVKSRLLYLLSYRPGWAAAGRCRWWSLHESNVRSRCFRPVRSHSAKEPCARMWADGDLPSRAPHRPVRHG